MSNGVEGTLFKETEIDFEVKNSTIVTHERLIEVRRKVLILNKNDRFA